MIIFWSPRTGGSGPGPLSTNPGVENVRQGVTYYIDDILYTGTYYPDSNPIQGRGGNLENLSTIFNAANRPLNQLAGTTPDVSGALLDYFQPMVFMKVGKIVKGFQVQETPNPVSFRGVAQPLTERQLLLKPEGQRAWTWIWLQSDLALVLNVDDVVTWNGIQTRVMARKDNAIYGYIDYHLVQDWEGAGP